MLVLGEATRGTRPVVSASAPRVQLSRQPEAVARSTRANRYPVAAMVVPPEIELPRLWFADPAVNATRGRPHLDDPFMGVLT